VPASQQFFRAVLDGEAAALEAVETHRIIRVARMLQEYELMFRDTLLAWSAHET
jgi:hypothetical protein